MKTTYFSYQLLLVACLTLIFTACKGQENNTAYKVYGDDFDEVNVATDAKMLDFYDKIEMNDSLDITFKAKVNEVCKMKGCWMKIGLDNDKEVMVKFKDYGFFVPKDIEGKEVIVSGKAFVNLVSVDELKHYAEDAGKTKEEIAAITKPAKTYSFEAEGVKIEQ
jgi:hypothetical protein